MTGRNNNRTLIVLFLLSASVIFFLLTALLWFYEKEPDVFCHAELKEYAGDGRITTEIDATLNNGRGTIALQGIVTHPDGKSYHYYVRKYLTYTVDDDVLLMKSTPQPVFISQDTDLSTLKGYIHSFFLSNEAAEFSLRINRLANREDAWVMSSTGRVPHFVCVPN
ncbi:hypothetical protein SM907_24570 (plasmid) [Klebsiella aerogenes]|uniref:hypothetical protein n=1 Tax=Klebsiella aerogenes TaxID=548 RepID=UPI002A7FD1F2|nr:hypothetical protein [Klebsiella aerogenes]WPS11043.1 hypothetical protein SM907_24570 [Klebsiella aerogenes]